MNTNSHLEFERAIPTRRRESAVEKLIELGFVWNNQKWEDRRQPVGQEPINVEAVATVRRKGDGDRYIDWLTEGGIADMEVGDVLMVADRSITDDDGAGEVYTTPPTQTVELDRIRALADEIDINYNATGNGEPYCHWVVVLRDVIDNAGG